MKVCRKEGTIAVDGYQNLESVCVSKGHQKMDILYAVVDIVIDLFRGCRFCPAGSLRSSRDSRRYRRD